MKKWQRYWLYLVVAYSTFHLFRDVFQSLGIKIFLSTVLVRSKPEGLWGKFFWSGNTYIIEIAELALSFYILKRKRFGKLGYLTILIAVATGFFFTIYLLVP